MSSDPALVVPSERTNWTNEGNWASPGWRSARTRSRWAIALLVVAGFSSLATISYCIQAFDIIDQIAAGTLSSFGAAAFVETGRSLDNFGIASVIACAVAFLAWLSRSVENVPPLGRGTPKNSPRASVGWWFVPIASLVKPYQIVADLYRRMTPATQLGGTSVAIVLAWWLCFIGQGLLTRAGLALPGSTLATVRTTFTLILISSVIDLAAAGLAIVIVRRIQHGADMRAGELGLAPQPVGPVWPAVSSINSAAPPTSGSSPLVGPPVSTQAIQSTSISAGPAVAFCPSCGAARTTGARFCAQCGKDLDLARA